jgi:uncharacterized protein (DUF433 family)
MAITRFLDKMVNFLDKGDYSTKSLEQFNQEIMRLFLDVCSETEGNLNCFEHVEYGKVSYSSSRGKFPKIGFKLKGEDILISDILRVMENMEEVPNEVKEYYPKITHAEFRAALRMATVLITLYEDEIKEEE